MAKKKIIGVGESVKPAARSFGKPGCSMVRDASLPDFPQYDGMIGRMCALLGINTGSTCGDFEALKLVVNQRIKESASLNGWPSINSGRGWYGSGRLVVDERM